MTLHQISELSFEEGIAEIEKCEDILNKLYKDAGVERKYRPFRFPYGDKGGDNKEAYQEYFKTEGFTKLDDREISVPWWSENGLDKEIDTYWTFDFKWHIVNSIWMSRIYLFDRSCFLVIQSTRFNVLFYSMNTFFIDKERNKRDNNK